MGQGQTQLLLNISPWKGDWGGPGVRQTPIQQGHHSILWSIQQTPTCDEHELKDGDCLDVSPGNKHIKYFDDRPGLGRVVGMGQGTNNFLIDAIGCRNITIDYRLSAWSWLGG
ncbi:hypothetical protein BDV41DRAFT_578489 [Aspergillus transmontanensis]|uniref:Uncharacterized protein n=1 Tax=Aspergillus transmontanensis TaxID=1034304 RepID=A0A5N6VTR5_9EURO|nr:hypothetical protein BDV41DRAFT_578489 [Aspergillus transmontanensis]